MPFFCSCYPLGSHRSPCPLANDGNTITTTGTDSPDVVTDSITAIPGFTCIQCGVNVLTVCNGLCITCASGEPVRQRGSWVCDRCGISNAPHADQCTCLAETVANVDLDVRIVSTDKVSIPPLEPVEFTIGDEIPPPNWTTCGMN